MSELVGKKRAMGHNFEALTEAADVGSAASFQGDELQQRKKQKVFRVDSERVKWKELIDARLKVPRNAAQTAKDKVGKVNEMAAVEGIGGITGLKDCKDIMERRCRFMKIALMTMGKDDGDMAALEIKEADAYDEDSNIAKQI